MYNIVSRSSLLSLPFAFVFKLLSILRLDFQWLVIYLPKLLIGVLTACGDYSFYKMIWMRDGTATAGWFLLLLQTNWFLLYSGSRTLVNTYETSLLCFGLSLYPRNSYLLVVALSVMVRPTVVIAWLPLILQNFWKILNNKGFIKLVKMCFPPALIVAVIMGIDSIFYGRVTLTPYNFFEVNIIHNLGSFYGSNPVYWYLTNSFMPIMGPLFFVAVFNLVTDRSRNNITFSPVLLTFIFLSLLEHKEMRFIQLLLPLLFYSLSRQLHAWYKKPPNSTWVMILTCANVPLALYLSLIHQRGVVDAAVWLGGQSQVSSALYLMPCHSSPMYSHTHNNIIKLGYLTCLPNFENVSNYKEEVEVFYSNPAKILVENFMNYQCLVFFDELLSALNGSLSRYEEVVSFFHSHVASGRVGKSVHIYCKTQ